MNDQRILVILLLMLAACSPTGPPAETTPVAPVQHTVVADGHSIAVWSKLSEAPIGAMVLVHGRTWSALPDFDLQVPGENLSMMDWLVDAGFDVFAVDLRGYGATPRDSTGWLSPSRASDDLAAVLEWTREETGIVPSLFGWSNGSLVSHLTAQERPDLMSSLILYGYPWTVGRTIPEYESPAEPPRHINTAEAAASDFIVPDVISPEAVAAYVEASLAADPVRVDWNRLWEWNALSPERLTVPTLLIHGEFDPLTPIKAQKEVFAGIATPDRQWTIVPGGDHAAILESPREYLLRAVVDYVTRPRN